IGPHLLQARNRRSRQAGGILSEQRHQRVLEVTGRHAVQVEDWKQHFEAFGAARIRRKNRRREPNAIFLRSLTISHARLTYGDRTDAGHDLALRQMAVAHNALTAVIGELVSVLGEEVCDLRFNGLREQSTGAVAKNFCQWINKGPWWDELGNVTIGHGVSLL